MYDTDDVDYLYLFQELQLREQANVVLKHKVLELERKEKQEALDKISAAESELPVAGTKGQSVKHSADKSAFSGTIQRL